MMLTHMQICQNIQCLVGRGPFFLWRKLSVGNGCRSNTQQYRNEHWGHFMALYNRGTCLCQAPDTTSHPPTKIQMSCMEQLSNTGTYSIARATHGAKFVNQLVQHPWGARNTFAPSPREEQFMVIVDVSGHFRNASGKTPRIRKSTRAAHTIGCCFRTKGSSRCVPTIRQTCTTGWRGLEKRRRRRGEEGERVPKKTLLGLEPFALWLSGWASPSDGLEALSQF